MCKLKVLIFLICCLGLFSGVSFAQTKRTATTAAKKPAKNSPTFSIGATANDVGNGENFIFSLAAESSYLDGIFIAPAGVTVVLQKDGTDDLTLTAKSDGNAEFSRNPFKFPKLYLDGTPYTLSIKSSSPGQTCWIEKGARGTISLSPGFVRVGCDYTYELTSRSTDNAKFGTFYDSSAPVVAGDFAEEGRYVAFVSSAVGLGGSLGKKRQIFWRDRNTGQTRLVSVGVGGAEGNGDSFSPSISADGQSVAFESYATNLVPIDTNKVRDIFVWNARTNTTTAVSTGAGEIETNSESFDPVISGDGNLIAFSSSADNLVPDAVSGTSTVNVYLKQVGSGQSPILISADPKTKKGVGGSNPSISQDGSRVAFYSYAWTLVENDKNGLWDIFLYDARNPQLKRLTLTAEGAERNQGTESISRVVAPSISGDGNFVAFATTADNMVPGDTNKAQDVFVVNTETGAVKRVSTVGGAIESVQGNADSPSGQGEKIAISYDASWVAFSTNAKNLGGNIILKNTVSGETRAIVSDQSYGVARPAISRNGGYVIFGAGSRLDSRYPSTGIFIRFTGLTRCRFCLN
jgi:Tol biopolymer transport system component